MKKIVFLLGLILIPAVAGATEGRIHQLLGQVWVNGEPAMTQTAIHFGDKILTGAGSSVTIILDENVYRLGPRALFTLPRIDARGVMRLFYGAVLAVFRHQSNKTIYTPTSVLGVRGTGLYLDAGYRQTYLCLCYGDVDFADSENPGNSVAIHADYHQAVIFDHASRKIRRGNSIDGHADANLFELEALAERTPPASFLSGNAPHNSVQAR